MFFRNGAGSDKRSSTRTNGSEAQLRELRTKARRRLIGALALVLAAFIVVPWLFDEPVPDQAARAPIVVPAPPAGLPAAPDTSTALADAGSVQNTAQGTVAPDSTAPVAPPDSTPPSQPPASTPDTPAQKPVPADTAAPAPDPTGNKPKAEPTPSGKPTPQAPTPVTRTDDGSVALALLAGKAPPAVSDTAPRAPAATGSFYLQVAAYSTEQDAQTRRDSLRQAGVTDAYVERGRSNGRTVYRLRVGPFGSHEAAQAAQTRLRALGYQNGLISGK